MTGKRDPEREAPGIPAEAPDTRTASTRSSVRSSSAAIYVLVTILALLLGVAAVVRTVESLTTVAASDLATFFLPSADYALRGDPWHLYAVRAGPPYTSYPDVDPPLSLILLAPLLRWAFAFGLTHPLGERLAFVSVPFLPLVALLGGLAVVALRTARPAVPTATRLLAFALVTLDPLTWLCIATWGHLEQPLMLCLLVAGVVALQARRALLCGVLVGLAILAGTAALFPVVALVALLVARRQWRAAALVGGLALAVVVLGMAPFLLADRRDTLYAFVTWRGGEQIGGDSLWSIFTVDAVSHALPRMVKALVRRLDTPLMLLLAVAVAIKAARRPHVSTDGPEVWAVLTLAALGVPLLAKVVWPYYYLQPFVLLLIYEGGTLQWYRAGPWRWPVVSGGFLVVTTTLAPYIGLHSAGALVLRDPSSDGLIPAQMRQEQPVTAEVTGD